MFWKSVCLLCLTASVVIAQDAPSASEKPCTKDYLRELEDDALANRDMRRWTTDYLRPACRAIQRTESLTGKLFTMLKVNRAWDATVGKYITIDPQLTSNTCKYVRRLGENLLTPEEDEQRLRREIQRCEHMRKE